MKTDIKRINRILGLISSIILSSNVFSQSEFCAFKSTATSTHPSQAYQPTSCTKLLEDLAPTANDSAIEVNVKFWIFAPTTNSTSGAWTYSAAPTTSATLQALLDSANTTYSTIPAIPKLPVVGTSTTFTNAKIKLVLKDYEFVNDDFAYENIEYYADITTLYDTNAINVYVGTWTTAATDTIPGTQTTYTFVKQNERMATCLDVDGLGINRMYLTPSWYKVSTPVVHDDLSLYGGTFAHEAGHVFGLDHTSCVITTTAGIDTFFTYVKSPLSGCCLYAHVMDTYFETYPPPPPQCTSDNLMSQDAGCNRYLSPQQAGVMHYTLRTRMSNLIAASSYTEATTRNPAYDYTLTTNETIENTNRYFKGNIVVPSGKVLTIKCLVGMTHKGKIIIKKGGKLILDGGILTNISGRLWEGIDVEGDPQASQIGNALWQNHGQLKIINGGTIENSVNGVRNYGYLPDGTQNFASTGGIITGNHARFINNVRDVEFLSFPINYGSFSRFDECEFKTTGQINDNSAPYVHVSLYNIKGVEFNGCVFENAAQTLYPNVGQGIHSIDAIYTVNDYLGTPTQFKNFNQGISVSNFNPLRPVNVYESYFENNLKGVEMSSVKGQIIEGNTFDLGVDYTHGVDLTNCNNYTIGSNTITGGSGVNGAVGTYAISSGAGTHRIFRNQFSNLSMGVCAQFDNSGPNILEGLMMNCNLFNIGTANNFDIAMLGANTSNAAYSPSVAKFQGVITDQQFPNQSNPTKLVRNQYGAACSGTNPQKKWWINAGTKAVEHAANSEAVTRPVNCSSSLLNIINSGISLDFGSHCSFAANRPSSNEYCECPKCCLLDDINLGVSNALTEATSDGANYFSLIDGGDTQNLINLINDPTKSSSDLQTALAAASPYVSDSVLKLFFNNPSVSVADAQSIHNLNKPVTEAVWNTILDLDYSVSEMEVFTDQQEEELYSARYYLEGKYSSAYANLQSIYAEKLTYYLQDTLDGAQDTAIALLAKNIGNLPDAKVQLVNAYANGGYYTRAFSFADSLSGFDEFEEIMELEIALLKLDTAKNKIFKILDDAGLRGTIMEFAADSTKEGSWQARAVLNKVYGTDMHFLYLVPEESEGSRIGSFAKVDSSSINTFEEYLKVFPNPTEGKFNLYYASASKEPARLSIVDMLGKELINTEIKPNQNQEYESTLLGNGIYFVVIKQNNKVVHNKKLIILK